MRCLFFLFSILPFSLASQGGFDPVISEQWEPEPRIVTSGQTMNTPPSDAIILWGGEDSREMWMHRGGEALMWTNEEDALVVKPGSGDILSRQEFGDIQLHLEFRTPAVIDGEGQGRGNSGLYFQGRYEVQILDSYDNRTYSNGQAASIYKQTPPLVNACRPPGEWQTYDVIFTAPRFNEDGMRTEMGRITVFHNGVLVQNNTPIYGTTEYRNLPKNEAHGPGPIILQDHDNLTAFRNIWVREL
ncbi:MAG: DUF1080 domain-containing protein [Bacteroidota bacterium]